MIDASNAAQLPALALDRVEPAGRVVYIGLAGGPSLVDTRTLALKDVTAVGILSASPGLDQAIAAYADGRVDPRPLVAATVGLDQVGAVLAGRRPAGAGPGPKMHIDTQNLNGGTRMNDFDSLIAVVTGGASGIGAATAALLQDRGARVAVLDRNTDGAPDGVRAIRCDITDTAAVEAAVSEISRFLGGLDVLVNNRGSAPSAMSPPTTTSSGPRCSTSTSSASPG